MRIVREVLKKMQGDTIVGVTQKEGGTQLKLVIDFKVNKADFFYN